MLAGWQLAWGRGELLPVVFLCDSAPRETLFPGPNRFEVRNIFGPPAKAQSRKGIRLSDPLWAGRLAAAKRSALPYTTRTSPLPQTVCRPTPTHLAARSQGRNSPSSPSYSADPVNPPKGCTCPVRPDFRSTFSHWTSQRLMRTSDARSPSPRKSISSGPAPYNARRVLRRSRNRANRIANSGRGATAPPHFSSVGLRNRTSTRPTVSWCGSRSIARGAAPDTGATWSSRSTCSASVRESRARGRDRFPARRTERMPRENRPGTAGRRSKMWTSKQNCPPSRRWSGRPAASARKTKGPRPVGESAGRVARGGCPVRRGGRTPRARRCRAESIPKAPRITLPLLPAGKWTGSSAPKWNRNRKNSNLRPSNLRGSISCCIMVWHLTLVFRFVTDLRGGCVSPSAPPFLFSGGWAGGRMHFSKEGI